MANDSMRWRTAAAECGKRITVRCRSWMSSLDEFVDLYRTWTDLLELPTPKGLHGKSLTPILHNPDAKVRETALSIHNWAGGGRRSAERHYMNYAGKGEKLYDMIKDPDQYTNLVSDPKYRGFHRKSLYRCLSSWLEQATWPE
jgi:arylsulfatase A-like enzyme